jgi:hypothetical protein
MRLPIPKSFTWKGFGRIYVYHEADISRVLNILTDMDPYEVEHYLPSDLICTVDKYPQVVHVGKFEIDTEDLYWRCYGAKVPIIVFDAGNDDCPSGIELTLTREDLEDELQA